MAKILKTQSEIRAERDSKAWFKKQNKGKPKKNKAVNKKKKKALPYESKETLKQMNYAGFLQSKYWAFVRNLVLKRDKFACVVCKSKTELQVHHDTYKNHFNELQHLSDLMTLCRPCHKEHHYAQP